MLQRSAHLPMASDTITPAPQPANRTVYIRLSAAARSMTIASPAAAPLLQLPAIEKAAIPEMPRKKETESR